MTGSVEAREAAGRYLAGLFDRVDEDLLIEVRFRVPSGMAPRFFSAERRQPVVDSVVRWAAWTDVFVGVLPRVRRRGRLEDLTPRGGVFWADCDTTASAGALASFEPAPSMVVATSGPRRHAYWLVTDPVDLRSVERFNRRLALALGADMSVVTKPHTILRPPGTVNRKRHPTPVRLISASGQLVSVEDLDRRLPREPSAEAPKRAAGVGFRRTGDPLELVPPRVYFERLTGIPVGRSGKVRCPFHEERTPSLHVYEQPGGGWYCFGCGRGGSIYDLAALLSGRSTRGRDFIQLRRELEELDR